MRIVVQNLGGVFGHETFEHAVEHVDERSARAEVVLEIDDLADLCIAIAKAIRAIEEALRIGKAKPINALFHIADAEEVLLTEFRVLSPLPVLRERVRVRVCAEKPLTPALSRSTGRGGKTFARD